MSLSITYLCVYLYIFRLPKVKLQSLLQKELEGGRQQNFSYIIYPIWWFLLLFSLLEKFHSA